MLEGFLNGLGSVVIPTEPILSFPDTGGPSPFPAYPPGVTFDPGTGRPTVVMQTPPTPGSMSLDWGQIALWGGLAVAAVVVLGGMSRRR
jgi:hypothetical protein